MQSRRDFCKTAVGALALGMVPEVCAEEQLRQEPYRRKKPLQTLQQEFLDLRFGMFLHFNLATYQDREWGDPTGSPAIFNPTHLDTDGWAAAAKSADIRYGCLTTKHHDGFCIWPTKTGVAHAERDVVRAYVDSFRAAGLKVGLYYSILDLRNDIRHFNVTPEKVALIKAQLTELLTNYGEVNVLIFDGWDAPWSRISYEEVPFAEIYRLVKELQPNCLISELNASEYPKSALYYTDIKAFEQNAGQHLPEESEIPSQSCVTLTEGWFWKEKDVSAELKPAKQVVEEWLIPQNRMHCNLILNAPPNREGRLSPNVVQRLAEIGSLWKPEGDIPPIGGSAVITTRNLATGCPIHASSSPDTVGPDMANDGRFASTWYPDYGQTTAWLEVSFPKETAINTLVFVEPVGRWNDYKVSRIKNYKFELFSDGVWKNVAMGDVPREVQIHGVRKTLASKMRLSFEASADTPHIAEIGAYFEP